MAKMDVAPTRSNLLALTRQLGFAEEGYELLEQKRQILVWELMNRLGRARELEQKVARTLEAAHAALREAELDVGAMALDAAALAVAVDKTVDVSSQRLMGMTIATLSLQSGSPPRLGLGDSSLHADAAADAFARLLPELVELAQLNGAIVKIATELRKTQRRCNALTKTFLPRYRETISYIRATLEERERESFAMFKLVRDRLSRAGDGEAEGKNGA